jgi:hypothetical protein
LGRITLAQSQAQRGFHVAARVLRASSARRAAIATAVIVLPNTTVLGWWTEH